MLKRSKCRGFKTVSLCVRCKLETLQLNNCESPKLCNFQTYLKFYTLTLWNVGQVEGLKVFCFETLKLSRLLIWLLSAGMAGASCLARPSPTNADPHDRMAQSGPRPPWLQLPGLKTWIFQARRFARLCDSNDARPSGLGSMKMPSSCMKGLTPKRTHAMESPLPHFASLGPEVSTPRSLTNRMLFFCLKLAVPMFATARWDAPCFAGWFSVGADKVKSCGPQPWFNVIWNLVFKFRS